MRRLALLASLALAGCEGAPSLERLPVREIGPDLAAEEDAAPDRAVPNDAAPMDAAAPDLALDAGPLDATPDGAPPDLGPLDEGPLDQALPDQAIPDAGGLACAGDDPRLGEPCQGFVGRCVTPGTLVCEGGALRCALRDPQAEPERCNGQDDDCDGAIDEAADAPCGPGAVCERLACRCPAGRADVDGDPNTGCEAGCAQTAVRDGPGARVVPAAGLAGDRALVFAAADGLWILTDGAAQPAQVLPLPIDFGAVQAVAVPGPRVAAGVVGAADDAPLALWLADTAGAQVVVADPGGRGIAAAAALITADDQLVAAVALSGAPPEVQVYALPWGEAPGAPALRLFHGGQPALAADGATVRLAVVGSEQTSWVADVGAPVPVQLQGFGGAPAAARLVADGLYVVGADQRGGARWARWPVQGGQLGPRAAGPLDMRQPTGLMAGPLGVAALGVGRDLRGTRMPVAQWFGAFGPGGALPVVDGANAIVQRARRFGAGGARVAWIELDGQSQVRWTADPCGD